MSISVREVTKLYGAQKALDNVSFEVKTGEIVGFLGPNGAGKSTLMRMLATITKPNRGKLRRDATSEISRRSMIISRIHKPVKPKTPNIAAFRLEPVPVPMVMGMNMEIGISKTSPREGFVRL